MTTLDFSSDLLVPSPEVLSYMVSALKKVFCSRMCKMLAKDLSAEVLKGFRGTCPRWSEQSGDTS